MQTGRTKKNLSEAYRRLRKHFGHRHWWPGDTPLEVMVGAILTQNTAWTNVEKAIANIKRAKVLGVNQLLGLPDARLAQMLRPSGYFNVKTKRLKDFLRFFKESYAGRVQRMRVVALGDLRKQLLDVRGIGPETADSILLYALGKPTFVVDAYTKRIFSRLGWVRHDVDYYELQEYFMKNIPRKLSLYNDYHAQIVQLGKDICRPKPRCEMCPLVTLCATGRNR
jgi:endonuclease III related protein